MVKAVAFLFIYFLLPNVNFAQAKISVSNVWVSDNGNGTYKNPIINADYSDPDVIRVGNDFYMISSSFNAVPGIPILHSTDLVNWMIIGHALPKLLPEADFNTVQHGNGVWAPSIRYHNKTFYIFYPDPDRGIFLLKSNNIKGPWSAPILVEAGKGLIDPCPLWDDNGKVYLVHAYAGSRAGFKSIIVIKEMNSNADKTISDAVMVYDGHEKDPTVEGPKLYKRNNYYYIFAPAGGVSTGWQLVLRSKNIYGPYERKVVMAQGKSSINGPHQGAWVTTQGGEDWFLFFQDKDAYGRVVHLQPIIWKNDWPVIGSDFDGDGTGEPVMAFKKPNLKTSSVITPQESDEFNSPERGLQWQWQANPRSGWAFLTPNGFLRMFCMRQEDDEQNKWMMPNFIFQKLPAEEFTSTAKISFHPHNINDRAALMLFGLDYAYISIVKKDSGVFIEYNQCLLAEKGKSETTQFITKANGENIIFRITVMANAESYFSFSKDDGKTFTRVPGIFKAKPGKWVGAKIGLFCSSAVKANDAGYADIDWFRIEKI